MADELAAAGREAGKTEAPRTGSVRRRSLTHLVAVALLLAVAAAGTWYWLHRVVLTAPEAAAPPAPTVVVAQPLVHKLTEWDEFTGRFEAVERVEVRARVGGYLAEVHFNDGQLVEKDQLLFTIDQRPFQDALNEVRAALDSANAALGQAQLSEGRTGRLRDTNSAAFQRATYEDQVQARLQAQAERDRAASRLAAAQLNLDYTTVRAPVRGRISNRRVDVGNLVGDTTLLTTIVSLDPIHFTFDMSEADFLAYQRAVGSGNLPSTRDTGTEVNLNLGDETEWKRTGKMNFVDNVVDQGSGTVRARAVLANGDFLIAPGQFGRIRIPGTANYDAVLIPEEAIVTDQSQKLVMLVDGDNKVQPRAIRPGPREGALRIVRSGLDGSERIIINGLMQARPGTEVVPQQGRIELPPTLASAGG